MQLLLELDRTPGCPHSGRAVTRSAVRGICLDGHRVLMVYSPVNGDYKFPGGGVDEGESHLEALAREITEECGMRMSAVLGEFGKMIEYDVPEEADFDLFMMTSYYYRVAVDGEAGQQRLDDYEADLGFCPAWVDIDQVIENNKTVYAENRPGRPRWMRRDLYVLEQVRQRCLS